MRGRSTRLFVWSIGRRSTATSLRFTLRLEENRPGLPLPWCLAMVKALRLSIWYDLSDVKLAEALDDRASFRRFCGFSAGEATPERTAFVRFRRELVKRSLDVVLFAAVTRQLDDKSVMVKTGTLVDATIIASASIARDDEARWVGHRRKAPVHGYKAHVATDADGGIGPTHRDDAGQRQRRQDAGHYPPPGPGRGLRRSRLRKSAKRDGDPCRGWNVASAGTGGLGRRGSALEARSLEPRRRPCPSPDRKGLRYLETLLRPSTHALAGARKGRPESAAHGHRFQSHPNTQHPQRTRV